MRIVLDTNVLVSGMINPSGDPGRIVDLLRSGSVELVVDDRILEEYADVLHREKFARYFSASDCDNTLAFLRHESHRVVSSHVMSELPDADDARFLEVALTAGVPLVTGNAAHYPARLRRGCEVLSPGEFLKKHRPKSE